MGNSKLHNQGTGFRTRKYENTHDFYKTPQWAVDAILEREELEGEVLDPCCGDGAIASRIKELFPQCWVDADDLIDRGYGRPNIDYLLEPIMPYDAVVMNPPFSLAEEFIRKALRQTKERKGKVFNISRLSLLEGQKRLKLFQEFPPARVWVFSKRVNYFDPEGNEIQSATSNCWTVWDWKTIGQPTELKWI